MAESDLPLAGLRVLDISSFIAAPAAAVVLGDWGADVIKVEAPEGDPNRTIMNDSANYPKAEVNYPWLMDSRNKRSIALDLKNPQARAALDRPRSALGTIYRTSDDRWLQLTIVREDKLWGPLCQALERPELEKDPRFATQDERRKRSAELSATLRGVFETRPYEHWRKALAANEVTFGVISRPSDIPDDEQAAACGAVVETAMPEMKRTLANPIRVSFAEQRIAGPAPALGQHGDDVMRDAGLSAAEIAQLRSSGALR
jgi:crotonobetainyl-CoA:carnitine CoA-transferase CaiB-like acyl-CoA transferase